MQVLVLLQASIAAQVRVAENVFPHKALVTVPTITIRLVPQVSDDPVGESNDQVEPHSTDLLVEHVIEGGVVSITVTVWLQVLVLLQASMAAHVRVAEKVFPHKALVTVARMTMRFVPHASVGAVGTSNDQAVPHSTLLLAEQVIAGGVVSTTVTV